MAIKRRTVKTAETPAVEEVASVVEQPVEETPAAEVAPVEEAAKPVVKKAVKKAPAKKKEAAPKKEAKPAAKKATKKKEVAKAPAEPKPIPDHEATFASLANRAEYRVNLDELAVLMQAILGELKVEVSLTKAQHITSTFLKDYQNLLKAGKSLPMGTQYFKRSIKSGRVVPYNKDIGEYMLPADIREKVSAGEDISTLPVDYMINPFVQLSLTVAANREEATVRGFIQEDGTLVDEAGKSYNIDEINKKFKADFK